MGNPLVQVGGEPAKEGLVIDQERYVGVHVEAEENSTHYLGVNSGSFSLGILF